MSGPLSIAGTFARYSLLGLAGLPLLWALVAGGRWAMSFHESVTLPNGMQLGREFDWNRYGRWDLFAENGRARLARDLEFVCFNDRYVFVQSYDGSFTGLYDAVTDSRLMVDYSDAMEISGLDKPGGGCNGNFNGSVGPGLLLDNGRPAFVPPCTWRTVDNEALRDRACIERPCAPGSRTPERQ